MRAWFLLAAVLLLPRPASADQPPMNPARLQALVRDCSLRLEQDVIDASAFTADAFAADNPEAPGGIRERFGAWLARDNADMKTAVELRDEGADITELQPKFEALMAKTKGAVALYEADKTCRASQPCLNERWAAKVRAQACTDILNRTAAVADMAREKSNPSGVVDLLKLHDLGRFIQDADARIADARKAYLSQIKKPLPPCPISPAVSP